MSVLHQKFNIVPSQLTDVGVLKDEALVQLVFEPVHLRSNDAEQGLGVDKNLDTILLNSLIKGSSLVHVFEVVC